MADWKQITARIRRARTGKDPVGQLAGLYEKTRDAMVAFELARVFETAGQNADAAKWYVAAAERFRRADWKSKAQEAAVRLGADISAASAELSGEGATTAASAAAPSPEGPAESAAEPAENSEPQPAETVAPAAGERESGDGRRRRRGRRGGRNRRKSEPREEVTAVTSAAAIRTHTEESSLSGATEAPAEPSRHGPRRALPAFPVEAAPDVASASVRGRSGDPGLSSRLSSLEMQLRRLLNCPPARLSDADHAPAGPGVLLLTDSDLTSYYYVEPCQTLRIAVGNLLRGNASRRGGDSIKPRLAEHLGIAETRVAKYLADHCVVRWLQLDDGASHFAHFAVAVLRPSLNE